MWYVWFSVELADYYGRVMIKQSDYNSVGMQWDAFCMAPRSRRCMAALCNNMLMTMPSPLLTDALSACQFCKPIWPTIVNVTEGSLGPNCCCNARILRKCVFRSQHARVHWSIHHFAIHKPRRCVCLSVIEVSWSCQMWSFPSAYLDKKNCPLTRICLIFITAI